MPGILTSTSMVPFRPVEIIYKPKPQDVDQLVARRPFILKAGGGAMRFTYEQGKRLHDELTAALLTYERDTRADLDDMSALQPARWRDALRKPKAAAAS
jgi:hypothetical protein